MEEDNVLPVKIMLVEDNPGDIRLIKELFSESKTNNQVKVAYNGEEAIQMLHSDIKYNKVNLPDLILLDLNLPKKNGKEVLKEIKADPKLKHIPVIVLTTSQAEEDIIDSYKCCANSYITKPVDLDCFRMVINSIQDFWFNIVQLPRDSDVKLI